MIDRDQFNPPPLRISALTFLDEQFNRVCDSCGVEFVTKSRRKPLCDVCQNEKTRRRNQRYYAKRRSRA